ncbi:flagellar assembly protein FliH [Celerinatantimonas sp. YJH-8]|uniref:flagellar assembly protein FliH n=1 Tax=Celerinatantimonas sp. YJH-8 TaxID=3228714 RepID=UPI0038BFAC81
MTEYIRPEDIEHLTNRDDIEPLDLPDFGPRRVEPKENAFNRQSTWYQDGEPVVDSVEEPEEIKPLTIEDIEEIRQAAYEEGFAEGQAAGHQQGLEAGRLEGLAQGHKEGTAQGLKEGLEQGQQQIETLSGYWRQLIDELENPLQQVTVAVQQQLVELIAEVAQSILHCELTTNEQVIIQTVKEALQAMPVANQTLKIYLHPDDLMIIEGVYPAETLQKNNWQLLTDASLSRGDCQITTENSRIDLSMKEVIEQALRRFTALNNQQVAQADRPSKPEAVAKAYEPRAVTEPAAPFSDADLATDGPQSVTSSSDAPITEEHQDGSTPEIPED